MEMKAKIRMDAKLSAVVIRADGTREDLGDLAKRKSWWRRFLDWLHFDQRGIVTTAGVTYMATDFASGGVTPTISGFKFHASGVGTTAAAITDTTIQTDPTPAPARVIGTPSNPSAQVYKTVATIAYTGTNSITEWGLFSASTSGTLWDRRVFGVITVASGDSIQFSYSLTVP